MLLACHEVKRYIKAGQSHVNRDENQYFLISNNLKIMMMMMMNTILQFVQSHFKIQK